jgi:hypothetical protein
MNALQQIQAALGVKKDAVEVVTVVSLSNGFVEAHGQGGKVLRLAGSWQTGTKLAVRNGVVESVVHDSGVVVYED